jgi:hypothetical protein
MHLFFKRGLVGISCGVRATATVHKSSSAGDIGFLVYKRRLSHNLAKELSGDPDVLP